MHVRAADPDGGHADLQLAGSGIGERAVDHIEMAYAGQFGNLHYETPGTPTKRRSSSARAGTVITKFPP